MLTLRCLATRRGGNMALRPVGTIPSHNPYTRVGVASGSACLSTAANTTTSHHHQQQQYSCNAHAMMAGMRHLGTPRLGMAMGGQQARTFLEHLKTQPPPAVNDERSVAEIVNSCIAERSKSQLGKDLFTVLHIKGKQYKVSQGDVIIIDNIEADVGAQLRLEKILMVGNRDYTVVGGPLVPQTLCHVKATVLEKTRNRRVIVFKMKRRKRYRKKNHHRHLRTALRIDHIMLEPTLEATDGLSTPPERANGKHIQNAPSFDKLSLSLRSDRPERQGKVTLARIRDGHLD